MLIDNSIWVYEVMILVYAASVILYFYDFLQTNKNVNRIAYILLIVVWVIQTIFFHMRMKQLEYLPIMTLFETLFFYSWVLVCLSLVINYLYRMDLLVFSANVFGFSIVILNVFVSKQEEAGISEILQSDLLNIHIIFAIASYALFSISFLFSVMYLLQVHMLKSKRIFSNLFKKLPPLDKLDRFSYLSALIAFPVLTISLVLGTIWAYMHAINIWLDWKFISSLIILFVYGLYLYRRVAQGWQGRKSAVLNIAGFALVLINYFISNILSNFHRWI